MTHHGARLLDTALDRLVVPGYSRVGYVVRRRLPGWPGDPDPGSLTGRTALVTGASSGLGAAAAGGLARLGARVHLVVRDPAKGERIRDTLAGEVPGADLSPHRCDVSDLDDVRRFASALLADEDTLDVVVHNAGTMPSVRTESAQGHELTMATHLLGPVLMTELLRPALARSADARTVWVTSGGMYPQRLRQDDPEYHQGEYRPTTAYARSKRAQVALTPLLAERWRPDGIGVHAMHPGWADTPGVVESLPGFHRLMGPVLRDPDEGADTAVWLAAARPAPPTGLLWHDRRPRPAHVLPRTRETEGDRASLWEWTRQALGITA